MAIAAANVSDDTLESYSSQGPTEDYRIKPDLTTLGKIIGGGFPIGAVGGKASIMNKLSPEGTIYQAGTLSGNPLAMAAGLDHRT